ncbi:SNF1-related protein kinase regulatory subunit gamma-like PV42b [Rhodamnia argentea]|uniref:SNF1-related protein kinase regulatory subunit gamma-like PV42b n=1 Tax=Rhodamnia argentea TaxID=178133 RepID=A0ABM3GYM9_9MYRT|nr:SNF1-related protein kinase regulatory subunit gamma-like PV42b [Rhodamnia argentea]
MAPENFATAAVVSLYLALFSLQRPTWQKLYDFEVSRPSLFDTYNIKELQSLRTLLCSSTFSRAPSIPLHVPTRHSQTRPKPTTTTKTNMQAIARQSPNGSSSSTAKQRLIERRVRDLILHKSQLVDVPHTASLTETMNALVTNRVLAVLVAAPPGRWIGAGGSMIMEAGQETGTVRKQYIGIVTMLDIPAHIGGDDDGVEKASDDQSDLEKKMATPVSAIIGHNLEGLSLWTFNPNTSILDCMEVLSKGIHRALVPIDSRIENIPGVELVESAPSYGMLTQMDVVRFLKDNSSEMEGIVTCSIRELGAISRNVYAITDRTKVFEAIKCMRAAMINAVPIVASEEFEHDHSQLLDLEGQGRKLMGTFSATDLRGCHLATLRSWLSTMVLDFTEKISKSPLYTAAAPGEGGTRLRVHMTCTDGSSLVEAMDKAVDNHVHRVWVVDEQGLLTGVVSLTGMIRALRVAILSA